MMLAETNLNLYITSTHPCPYLAQEQAVNLLVDPGYQMSPTLYARLLDSGFRRSGNDVYRPHCQYCQACVATRITAAAFAPNRSQQRNWQHNSDLTVRVNRSEGFKPAYDDLYRRYVGYRHKGGGMEEDSTETFASFLLGDWCTTMLVEFYLAETLLAVAAVDELSTGLSSVYTFFDPEASQKRGLGTYAVLWQIAFANAQGLPYVYPGYWIEASPKMRYKTQFQPMEGLINGQWQTLPKICRSSGS
ncbi:arginyltransferase [Candidatus Thiothrix anitrata]|jgi:arginine-tRNA-protein transferase|nr:arginyltransferase [Candidatus Thiothrix anitrata]